jgi:hypothetical protein
MVQCVAIVGLLLALWGFYQIAFGGGTHLIENARRLVGWRDFW